MRSRVVVVFDGDDTLWATEALYEHTRSQIRQLLQRLGVDGDLWQTVQREVDLERVAMYGFAWHRFAGSCALAAWASAVGRPWPARGALAALAFVVALGVFVRRAEVAADAQQVLQQLAQCGDLVLVTKGERWVQGWRIRQSRLRKYFTRVVIVPVKDIETFADAIGPRREGVGYWSVGNSIRSDIVPALAAGMCGVWLDGPMWEYERGRDTSQALPYERIARLADLPGLISMG